MHHLEPSQSSAHSNTGQSSTFPVRMSQKAMKSLNISEPGHLIKPDSIAMYFWSINKLTEKSHTKGQLFPKCKLDAKQEHNMYLLNIEFRYSSLTIILTFSRQESSRSSEMECYGFCERIQLG